MSAQKSSQLSAHLKNFRDYINNSSPPKTDEQIAAEEENRRKVGEAVKYLYECMSPHIKKEAIVSCAGKTNKNSMMLKKINIGLSGLM